MAYAKAIGCGRAGVIRTTFREEAIADLFGEQCVLTGGLIELMKAAFEVLVDRGYSPEVAYIECICEVEYMASLIQRVGLADLCDHISTTACYGGATRGRRLIDSQTRTKLNRILDEIEGAGFLEEFRAFVESGEQLRLEGRGRDLLVNAKANLDEVSKHDE
jgi:ketol-acid reductoisomerase